MISLTGVVALLLVAALAAEGQETPKIPRIGFLVGAVTEGAPGPEAFRQGLRELGYVEGQSIAIEWRWARGDAARLPDFAQELVRLKVDVIVANSPLPIRAAQRATRTIPIVMVYPWDPVALGFVASLARPGGNITGLSLQSVELVGKRCNSSRRRSQPSPGWPFSLIPVTRQSDNESKPRRQPPRR